MKEERQEYWKKKGYTKEQIECHLVGEREKSKQSRERRKKNNIKNKELIKQIKDDLLGKTFKSKQLKVKILSINPTVDGLGFYFKMHKTFKDGSYGNFKEFSHFEDYNKEEFIKYLKY